MSQQSSNLQVLHIEDDDSDRELVALTLVRAGLTVQMHRVETASAMQAALQSQPWDVVLSDYTLPQFDAVRALAILQQSGLDLPFIIVSGTIGEVQAVTALRAGAHDFVTKSNLARLAPAIERELRDAEERRARRAAQARLRAQEGSFRLLFESNPLPMWVYDATTLAFLEVNHSAVAAYGYSRDEFLGMTIADIRPAEDVPALLATVQAGRADFRPAKQPWRHRLKDGRLIEVEITSHALTFKGQAAVLVVAHDITERRRAEAQLHLQGSALAAAANAIVITDADGRIVWVNPAFTRLTGYAANEAIGNTPRLLKSGQQSPAFYASLWNTIRAGQIWHGEIINRKKDGRLYTEEMTVTPVRGPRGQITHFIGIQQDITERKRAEAQIQRQLDQLAALRSIDLAITGSLDLDLTLDIFLTQLMVQLGVDAADVLLLAAADQILTYAAGRGFRSSSFQRTRVRLGEGRAGRVAQERRIVAETEPAPARQASLRTGLLGADHFVSYYGVPLIAKGQVLGVLEVFHRSPLAPDQAWLDFLEALAGQAAIAIENATLFAGLQRLNQDLTQAYDATIEGWSRALDLRDQETEGHSQRVTNYTLRLAQAMDIGEVELAHIRRGALLHDIGKMGVPDNILFKPGPLTDDEWSIMRQHPTHAYELLSPVDFLRPALDIPYCHHEKWDGTGYPRGLRGEQIPLAARLFAVVDVWDALSSDRPYRPAWPAGQVLAHLRSLAGSHFDPRAVEGFLQLLG